MAILIAGNPAFIRDKYKTRIAMHQADVELVQNLTIEKMMEELYLKNECAKKQPQHPYWFASLRYGISAVEASFNWCNETIDNIKKTYRDMK